MIAVKHLKIQKETFIILLSICVYDYYIISLNIFCDNMSEKIKENECITDECDDVILYTMDIKDRKCGYIMYIHIL